VTVHDHVIVGANGRTSMRALGLIWRVARSSKSWTRRAGGRSAWPEVITTSAIRSLAASSQYRIRKRIFQSGLSSPSSDRPASSFAAV